MLNRFLIIAMLVLITINSEIVGQQIPFPFGVYVAVSEKGHPELETNYWQIKELGVNSIIQYLAHPDSNEASRDSVETFSNIIGLNVRSEKDLPLHYTTGFANKWHVKDTVTNGIGIKKNYGAVTTLDGVECLATGNSSTNAGNVWITGPDYFQEVRYFSILVHNVPLYYNFRLRARKGAMLPDEEGGMWTENSADTLLKIEITANYMLNNNEGNYILNTFYVTDGELSTSFPSNPLLLGQYTYINFMNDSLFKLVITPFAKQSGNAAAWIESNDVGTDTTYLRGVKFNVSWMGKRVVYIDYFDLYDDYIWSRYVQHPVDFAQDLIDYDAGYKDGVNTNLAYWNTRDEPYYLDTHEPYRVVDSILKAAGRTRLITPFITAYYGKAEDHWHGMGEADSGYARFTKKVQPHRFWNDHYPFGVGKSIWTEFNYLNLRLFETQYYTKRYAEEGYYYMAQAFGGNPGNYKYPAGREVWASIAMALAQGAKGIYFWKYYPHSNGPNSYFQAIVDANYQPTELYNYIKNQMVPRLSGKLGLTLYKSDYNFEYDIYNKPGLTEPITMVGNRISFIAGITSQENKQNTFIYSLFDSADMTSLKYLMMLNLPRDSVDTVAHQNQFTFNLTRPNQAYHNWTVRDIEDTNFVSYADSGSVSTSIPIYDCKIYSVFPSVVSGGYLTVNEYIGTNLSLFNKLTLTDTIFINTDKLYTINAPIDLQNGGFITGNGYIKSDSNFVITTNSWSRALLKGRVGSYPKLYWGSHPTISQMNSFKIYRKKQTPGFVLIATVQGDIRSYIDSSVTIPGNYQQNQTTAEYYIVGVYSNGKSLQFTPSTDTINYHRVNGTGLEKDGTNQTERITEYKLEQNYPNPFNPTTTITYQIKEKGFTTLKIYDLLGKLVTTLVNEEKENGKYSVEFNASRLSSGVYLYELRSNEYKSTKKLLLMK